MFCSTNIWCLDLQGLPIKPRESLHLASKYEELVMLGWEGFIAIFLKSILRRLQKYFNQKITKSFIKILQNKNKQHKKRVQDIRMFIVHCTSYCSYSVMLMNFNWTKGQNNVCTKDYWRMNLNCMPGQKVTENVVLTAGILSYGPCWALPIKSQQNQKEQEHPK